MNNLAKIILVDDHSLFREGIKLLIETEGLGEIIGEAENGKEFLGLISNLNPDLVLMDIEMPVMGGVEATKKAIALKPKLKILVLTMLGKMENYTGMISAGARGFVLKTSGKKELERAIKSILAGESHFDSEVLRKIIVNIGKPGSISSGTEDIPIVFSEKELEVLQLFCKGFTAHEIADKIFRSKKSVEAYRSKLLEKTGTKNTINLVIYAIKHRLAEV